MPRISKPKKAIFIIIINVGFTSKDLLDGEPFINKAKYAAKILLESKIFLKPKDEFCIITMGEKNSDFADIENVKLYSENLLMPNWEMVKYVNELTSKNYPCNWITALHSAIQFLGTQQLNRDCSAHLQIFNNFKEDNSIIDEFDIDVIINELTKFQNLHILFIGEKNINEIRKQKALSKNSISSSEKFVLSFVKKTPAQYLQINNFIEMKQFYVAPPPNTVAWKCDLQWESIRIPCQSYVQTSESNTLNVWKMQTLNSEIGESEKLVDIVKENIPLDIHRNEVDPDRIINSYKFGGKYIPVSKEDEESMKYTGTTKELRIYGFVSQDDVKIKYWGGSGSKIIIPQTGYYEIFYSFVQAMLEKQYIAIVRKVYADNNLPKMGILFPKMEDNDINCLIHLEIPFVDDIRHIQKRPIKLLEIPEYKETLETIGNVINSMIISESESEYFNLGMFPNICNQYEWNTLSHRALNPQEPLKPLDNYLKKYLEPPEYAQTRAKPHIEKFYKIFEHFQLNKKDKSSDENEESDPDVSKDNINEVENINQKDNISNEDNISKEDNINGKDNINEEEINKLDKDKASDINNSQKTPERNNEEFFSPEEIAFDNNELDDL